jgi:hypothetical protein
VKLREALPDKIISAAIVADPSDPANAADYAGLGAVNSKDSEGTKVVDFWNVMRSVFLGSVLG